MQSAPPEASQNATSVDQPQTPSPPLHHGLSDTVQQASDDLLPESGHRVPSSVLEDSDAVSVGSGSTQRGRSANTRRLSSRDSSSQEGSPGSRIEEYERSHTQTRKHSDGMIFQIIPSAKGKVDSVSVESLPNGAFPSSHYSYAALAHFEQRS